MVHAATGRWLATPGLLLASMTWGLMWYPYRWLAGLQIGADLAQMANYVVACCLGGLLVFGVMRRPWSTSWAVWILGLSAGWANIGYVFAVIKGEVVRITLLFYLAPLWTLLMDRWLLGARFSRSGWLVFLLSMAGAVTILWRPELGIPWPRDRYEWIALSGGICFALNNVLARQAREVDLAVRAFSIWLGCLAVSVVALLLLQTDLTPLRQASASAWMVLVGMGLMLVLASLGMQMGLQHFGATQAVVIMLFELVVATFSASLLTDETLLPSEWAGAAMIALATLFSGHMSEQKAAAPVV